MPVAGTYFLIDDLTLSGATAISPEDAGHKPQVFSLDQNYPNPFNPTTNIRYSLSVKDHVYLNIFDVTGREVATLVDQEQLPGSYEVRWNAENEAGGIYFYQVKVGNKIQTRKMTLIK